MKGNLTTRLRIISAIGLLWLLAAVNGYSQLPTQVKQVLTTTPSVNFAWDYLVADEANIDSFVLQRTAFATTSTITSPYSTEIVISQKTIRTATFTMPTGLTAGMKAFFRIVARKTGLADSSPSNVVEIDVVATPPGPNNLRFP